MASSSTTKSPCATCGIKAVGIFKCEGCEQVFCRKHVIEHRDILSQQLDEIVFEYDSLQQTITEEKEKPNGSHQPLIKQIDKWEKESIEKIYQTANEARQQVNELSGSSTGMFSKNLRELAQQLRKAREDDDYVETDLRTWANKLKQLKCDMNAISPITRIYEDPTKILISKIYVSATEPTVISEERFGEIYRDIRIEDNGCLALHNGTENCFAYVRGTKEYSKGKHQIRFIMTKRTASIVMSFNVAPTMLAISSSPSDETYHLYGWETDDGIIVPASDYQNSKDFKDFRGETIFELQITLDCDKHKISYFNERTRNTHEMNVNTKVCPLPWQLEFSLFDLGDRVQLLSSTQIS